MEWLYSLFFGSGIAHAVLIFALVITVGILLGKVKIGGVSLGTRGYSSWASSSAISA